jgi:uncharacterized iron-regulated membrane protein
LRLSNRRLFQVHGWLGINLGLLLFIACFSGAVATLSHEIEWALNPAIRATPPTGGAPFASWTSWYAAAQEAHPAARILSIEPPDGRRWATRVTIAYTDADWRHVYVDPYTATVNGSFSEFGVARFFRSFHKQFYIYPGSLPHGVYLVGPLGVILLGSLLTGLSFYRFRWRDLFMRGPWRSPRAFWSTLHRATGMWTVPMAVLITATGVWYLVERALSDANIQIPADTVISYGATPSSPPSLWPMPIEDAVALAERTVPNFRVTGVSFSRGPAPSLTLSGQSAAWLVRDAANTVRVNPYTARVERISLATGHHPLARWAHTADPLHFGTFGGLTTKLIWFTAGVLSSLAILLGVRVWYMRTVPAPALAVRPASVLFSIGVTLLVLGVSLYGCIVNIGDALGHAPAVRFAPLGAHQVGPVSVRLSAAVADGRLQIAGFVPHEVARARARRVSAWLAGPEQPAEIPDTVSVSAAWDGFHAVLDLVRAPGASHLWLSVADGGNRQAYVGVPISDVTRGTGTVVPSEVVPRYVWVVIALFTGVVVVICVSWSWWLPRSVTRNTKAPVRQRASPPLLARVR